jgi:hypothetical protein
VYPVEQLSTGNQRALKLMLPNAKPAAEAGQGVHALAGNDAFWKFHQAAFANQQSLSRESYEKWAQDAGVVDMAKFRAGLDSHAWGDKVS